MPLGDSERDPHPTPAVLRQIGDTDRWLQEQYEGIARARRMLDALRQWDKENDRPAHYDLELPSGAAA